MIPSTRFVAISMPLSSICGSAFVIVSPTADIPSVPSISTIDASKYALISDTRVPIISAQSRDNILAPNELINLQMVSAIPGI